MAFDSAQMLTDPLLTGLQHLPVFIVAGLALNLTPGADMALIARSSASQGLRAGVAAALGVSAGCGVHIALAAAGLTALLASSTLAFALLRWAGSAYLVWLGWGLIRGAGAASALARAAATAGDASSRSGRRSFAQGFLTNALNPKVAMFFLAFVPQFITADAPSKPLAFLVLGTVFVVNSTAVNLGLAWAVARMSRALGQRKAWASAGRWLNRGAGALFIGLGLRLAWGSPAH